MRRKRKALKRSTKLRGDNYTQFGRRLGVTGMAAKRMVLSGRLVESVYPDGSIDPVLGVQEYEQNTDAMRSSRSAPDPATAGTNTYQKARTHREAYRAKLAEMEYKVRSGELVPVKEVETAVFQAMRRVRERLQTMGARLAPVVAGMGGDADGCFVAIETEINHALDELSGLTPL